jgi:hypothetical protein
MKRATYGFLYIEPKDRIRDVQTAFPSLAAQPRIPTVQRQEDLRVVLTRFLGPSFWRRRCQRGGRNVRIAFISARPDFWQIFGKWLFQWKVGNWEKQE